MTVAAEDALEVGQLVRVRGQQWVVSRVDCSHQPTDELAAATPPGRTLVTLNSVSDDDLGEELTVVWEVEPGREVVPKGTRTVLSRHNFRRTHHAAVAKLADPATGLRPTAPASSRCFVPAGRLRPTSSPPTWPSTAG